MLPSNISLSPLPTLATLGEGLAVDTEDASSTNGFSTLFAAISRGETALNLALPVAQPSPLAMPELPQPAAATPTLMTGTGKALQAAGKTGKILPLPQIASQPAPEVAATPAPTPALEHPAAIKPRKAMQPAATADQPQPAPEQTAAPTAAAPLAPVLLALPTIDPVPMPAASPAPVPAATLLKGSATAPTATHATPTATAIIAPSPLVPAPQAQLPAGTLAVAVTLAAQPVAPPAPSVTSAPAARAALPAQTALAAGEPLAPAQIAPAPTTSPQQEQQLAPAPVVASALTSASALPTVQDSQPARLKPTKQLALPELASAASPLPATTMAMPEASPLATSLAPSLAPSLAGPAPAMPAVAAAHDLARIVDQLSAAREALAPATAALTIDHAEFGTLSLRFDQRGDGGLAVQLAASDPEAHRAVSAAMGAAMGGNAGQFMAQDGQRQGPSAQSQQQQQQPQQQSASLAADRDARGGSASQQQTHSQQQTGRQQPSGQSNRQPSSNPDNSSPRDGVFA